MSKRLNRQQKVPCRSQHFRGTQIGRHVLQDEVPHRLEAEHLNHRALKRRVEPQELAEELENSDDLSTQAKETKATG